MSLPEIAFTLLPDLDVAAAQLERSASLFTPGVDFALDADGDLEWPLRMTTGLEAVAQGIRIRMLMVKGEIPWNLDYGVPWLANDHVPESEALLGGKPERSRIRSALRKPILASPGVLELRSMTIEFDGPSRSLSVGFDVRAEGGTILGALGA